MNDVLDGATPEELKQFKHADEVVFLDKIRTATNDGRKREAARLMIAYATIQVNSYERGDNFFFPKEGNSELTTAMRGAEEMYSDTYAANLLSNIRKDRLNALALGSGTSLFGSILFWVIFNLLSNGGAG